MREVRALYTTDHCDAESAKNIEFKIRWESVLVCMRASVFMHVDGNYQEH